MDRRKLKTHGHCRNSLMHLSLEALLRARLSSLPPHLSFESTLPVPRLFRRGPSGQFMNTPYFVPSKPNDSEEPSRWSLGYYTSDFVMNRDTPDPDVPQSDLRRWLVRTDNDESLAFERPTGPKAWKHLNKTQAHDTHAWLASGSGK
jgi:hypothetical protein